MMDVDLLVSFAVSSNNLVDVVVEENVTAFEVETIY